MYRKSHTPGQRPAVSNEGMNHNASLSAPPGRARRIVDGTLDLAPRPTGGLLVTVRLPATP
jgi:hypothetical protein